MTQSNRPPSPPEDSAATASNDSQSVVYDGIQLGDGSLPLWWKLILGAIVVAPLLYLPYFHAGAAGRSPTERFETALAANSRLQFAEIGELTADEPTLVRFLGEPQWLSVGRSVFKTNCTQCHGIHGEGKVGPNLTDQQYKNVKHLEDIVTVLKKGAGQGQMPAWTGKLNENEIILVSCYVASLRGTNAEGGKGAEGQSIPPWPTASQASASTSNTEQTPEDSSDES